MTIEQRKKQLAVRTGILGASLIVGITVAIVACGNNPSSGNPTLPPQENTSSEMTETNTEPESVIPEPELDVAVLETVIVEAGMKTELAVEDFFSEYSGQVFTIGKTLTQEQLKTVGANYEVPIVCDDVAGVITVKVVDTTAPVIEGAKDRNTYKGATISYRKGITVTDNSGETISLEIDSSAVDLAKVGVYPVVFTARDSSGNVATVEIKINVAKEPIIDEEYVRPMVEKIVNEVTNETMSDWDKAFALFKWIRQHILYVGTKGDRSSIWTGAYDALDNNRGDCFVFYALYAAMLDICEIPNMQVARVGGTSNHWWNLVYVDGEWYHCDTSPRREVDKQWWCFMQTDAQIKAYEESYKEKPNYYTFDPSLYPERGTVIVYDGNSHKGNKID